MINLPEVAEAERKLPVIQRDDYTISLERTSGMTFIHCDFRQWSKTAYRNLFGEFGRLKWLIAEPIYALHRHSDKKHEKFLKMFNFTYLCDFVDVDGEEYQLYRT
jgi:hypothetical protein